MTRKNFFNYVGKDEAKIEAKRILASILETESLSTLNALYSPKEVQRPEEAAIALKHTILPFDQIEQDPNRQLAPVADTVASMGSIPGEPNNIQLAVKQPVKVKIIDKSNKQTNTVSENAKVVDDKVIISLDKNKCEDDYDFLSSAPPLDLSNDVQDTEQSEQIKALTDLVQSSSDGMMPKVVAVSGQPLPTDRVFIANQETIKPIDEDPEGFSVVGMDNDIGIFMMAPSKK